MEEDSFSCTLRRAKVGGSVLVRQQLKRGLFEAQIEIQTVLVAIST